MSMTNEFSEPADFRPTSEENSGQTGADNTVCADDLARALIEKFQKPPVTDKDYTEVFGWYHFDGGMRYLVHDPRTRDWSSSTVEPSRYRTSTPFDRANDGYRRIAHDVFSMRPDEAAEAMPRLDMISFLPTPDLPVYTYSPKQSEPFVHDGWLFSWFFFPELKRWVLGPLRRR